MLLARVDVIPKNFSFWMINAPPWQKLTHPKIDDNEEPNFTRRYYIFWLSGNG